MQQLHPTIDSLNCLSFRRVRNSPRKIAWQRLLKPSFVPVSDWSFGLPNAKVNIFRCTLQRTGFWWQEAKRAGAAKGAMHGATPCIGGRNAPSGGSGSDSRVTLTLTLGIPGRRPAIPGRGGAGTDVMGLSEGPLRTEISDLD